MTQDVLALLKQHRSIRKFTDRPVSPACIESLVEAGQAAATSSFIQACTVIQVTDPAKRAALAECAGNQTYVETAPVFLVFCADMQRHKQMCELHESEMLSGFTEQFITATVDCALFAQNATIAAESIGLGICYIGGLRNQIARVTEILELPHLVYPVFGMCLGYPDQDPEVKPRLPLSVILKQDRYDDSGDIEAIKEYDKEVSDYYQTRTGGNKVMGWSDQIAGMLVKEARPHMLDYLQKQGFLKR